MGAIGSRFLASHMGGRSLVCAVALLWLSLPACLLAAEAKAATVAEATQVIDFGQFPLLRGAHEPSVRSVGQLMYQAPSDCKAAFEFQRQQLLKQKWTEHPGAAVTDQYASGTFGKSGFVLSVATTPAGDAKDPSLISVMLTLSGNVDLKGLPLPAGAKETYVGPQVAMYSTTTPVEKTAATIREGLTARGWEPYGTAGDVQYFKQNAVRLSAMVSLAPAQNNQTSIMFSAEQLSADIPAPTETVQLQYSDSTKELMFDTKSSLDDIVAFYLKALAPGNWKPTTDHPLRVDYTDELIFRNDAKEMFTLRLMKIEDEQVLRVWMRFQTAAEVEAEEQKAKTAIAAAKQMAEKAAQEKNAPLPTVSLTLPAKAKLKEATKSSWSYSVASGQAQKSLGPIRKQLAEAGWEEAVTLDDGMIGEIGFSKDDSSISISYVDPGFIPGDVTIRATKVELQKTAAKK